MKVIEKIIIVVHDVINITLIKKYKDSILESNVISMNKISSTVGFIKKHKIPIFLFFADNNNQNQVYFTEDLPVISYLNLQMLLTKRLEAKVGNYDLKEIIKADAEKQKYLFVAANIDSFWKNIIKMTSSHFIGITFLPLEAQTLVKNLSRGLCAKSQNDEQKMQVVMIYEQKNQIQYLILINHVIHQTGFVSIDGISDKIIEGYVIQHLKDVHEWFIEYKKDAFIVMPVEVKDLLIPHKNDSYDNIALFTPYELSVITGTDQLIDKKSKFAHLCFIADILNNDTDFVFNIGNQKIAINKQKQHSYLNVASLILVMFLCFSSVFFYLQINENENTYNKLLKIDQKLQSEFNEIKEVLINHDLKNKEKILIYKFLAANNTSPIDDFYELKKTIEIKSLEWISAEIHDRKSDVTIKIVGIPTVDKSFIEKELMGKFNDYHLTTMYDEENGEIQIVLQHK